MVPFGQILPIMSDSSITGEGVKKRKSLSTAAPCGKRKRLQHNPIKIKGVSTRTRSSYVGIKSRLRNTTKDYTHKSRCDFTISELEITRKRRVAPATQSHRQPDSTGHLPAEPDQKEVVCSEPDLNCSKTLLRSFSLVATEFVLFLDAQNAHFQNAQPSVRLCAPTEDKYRKQKGDKLKYLKDALFSENPDYHPTETSFSSAIFFFLENMLRPDPFTVEYIRLVGQSLRGSSPTRTYLLLVEKKLDMIRSASSLPSTTTFDVFGLGDWGKIQALLSRLFHLPLATASSSITAGEKSEVPARSARHSVGSNHELKSQAAAEKSEDFMTGTRILGVWCDYVRTVGKLMHQHRDQPVVPTVEAITNTVRDMVLFTAQVRASESALAFDLGSVQMQRDIHNAVCKLDELVAELSVILIRYCSVPVANIAQAPARNTLFSNSSNMTSATDNAVSLQVSAEQLLRSVVPALRTLLTSWGDYRQTEATCRFLGAQLVAILEKFASNWQILRNNSTAPMPVIVTSKQLASVVGSSLRKMKLQLVKMAPVALKRETRTVPPTAFSSTSSSTSSSSAAPPLTTSTQPTGVNALIARVDAMLAELPPEKSEVDRLLRISDLNINA